MDIKTEQDYKSKINDLRNALLGVYDSLTLYDTNQLILENETLSQVMFRKMKANDIDLNKELGYKHLKPIERLK